MPRRLHELRRMLKPDSVQCRTWMWWWMCSQQRYLKQAKPQCLQHDSFFLVYPESERSESEIPMFLPWLRSEGRGIHYEFRETIRKETGLCSSLSSGEMYERYVQLTRTSWSICCKCVVINNYVAVQFNADSQDFQIELDSPGQRFAERWWTHISTWILQFVMAGENLNRKDSTTLHTKKMIQFSSPWHCASWHNTSASKSCHVRQISPHIQWLDRAYSSRPCEGNYVQHVDPRICIRSLPCCPVPWWPSKGRVLAWSLPRD